MSQDGRLSNYEEDRMFAKLMRNTPIPKISRDFIARRSSGEITNNMLQYGISNLELDHAVKMFMLDSYNKGFIFASPFFQISEDKLGVLIERLRLEKGSVFDYSSFTTSIYFYSTSYRAWLDHRGSRIHFICTTEEGVYDVVKRFEDCFIDRNDSDLIQIQYYFMGASGVDYNSFVRNKNTIKKIYPELYPDIDIVALNNEFQTADDSILMLLGDPGVGKTTFMRYLMQHMMISDGDDDKQANIAYAKDKAVMQQGEFWSMLASSNYDIVILDDMDFGLVTRTPEEHAVVSNLLSYSDGIFGSKSKIVITTNLRLDDIDEALLRPGRCFDVLKLNSLMREQALNAWTKVLGMSEEDFAAQWPNNKTITQADLMSFYSRIMGQRRERAYVKVGPKVYSVEDKVKKMIKNPVGFKS